MLISLYHLGLTLHTGAESPAAPPPSGISLDALSEAAGAAVSSLTWAHVVGAGSNQILIVTPAALNNGATVAVTGVTYGGVALTRAVVKSRSDSGYYQETSVWYLVNPAVGTADIVVTYTGTCLLVSAGAISLFSVHQTSPVNTTASKVNNQATDTISATTTVDKCWTFDAYTAYIAAAMTFVSWGAGQTENWQYDATSGTSRHSSGSSRKEDVATGGVSHAFTLSRSALSCHVLVAFAPA